MPDAARGLVGDDERERARVAPALEAEGFRVVTAPHGAALDLVRGELPDLVLAGVGLPPRHGRALTGASRRTPGPHTPVVVLLARGPGRTEAVLGPWPPKELAGFAGLSLAECDAVYGLFGLLAARLGLRFVWRRDGERVVLEFAR